MGTREKRLRKSIFRCYPHINITTLYSAPLWRKGQQKMRGIYMHNADILHTHAHNEHCKSRNWVTPALFSGACGAFLSSGVIISVHIHTECTYTHNADIYYTRMHIDIPALFSGTCGAFLSSGVIELSRLLRIELIQSIPFESSTCIDRIWVLVCVCLVIIVI